MEKVLRLMRDEDEDLVTEGLECWVGLTRTSRTVVHSLLGLCLIKQDEYTVSSFRRYVLSEDGTKILADPVYIPRILRTKEGRLGATMWIRTHSVVNAIQALPWKPKRT